MTINNPQLSSKGQRSSKSSLFVMNVSTKRPMKSHGNSQEVSGQHVSRSAAIVHLTEDEDMISFKSYPHPHLNAHGGTFWGQTCPVTVAPNKGTAS